MPYFTRTSYRRALAPALLVLAASCSIATHAVSATAAQPTSHAAASAPGPEPSLSTPAANMPLPSSANSSAVTTHTASNETMSKANPLPVGAEAPVFTYRTADGKEHSTADLKGKPFVVYFYPKDNTPGCTTQACGFRDSYAQYEAAGITVIGVSADSEESHNKFRAKHELPFGLTSDPERKVIEAYGVWGPKLFMGKSFLGINRISFLVDKDGKIAKVYPKVKVADHAETVLADALGS